VEDTVVVTAVVWSVWFGVQAHKGRISIAAVNRVEFTERGYPFVVCTDTLVLVGVVCSCAIDTIWGQKRKVVGY